MSAFPDTPTTLLTRIAARETGGDETNWMLFFELYAPAMRLYLERHGAGPEAEDLVQDVFQKLVAVLREGRYDRSRGPFRAYLATVLHHALAGLVRRNAARGGGRFMSIDTVELGVVCDPAVPLDAEWTAARHQAAVRHVLENTALSAQSKAIYADLQATDATCADVARRLKLSAATVRQVKSRIDRMVRALERRMGGV